MTGFREDRWNDVRKARLARVSGNVLETTLLPEGPTFLDLCAEAAEHAYIHESGRDIDPTDYRAIARAVIQTIIDHTGSPYTVDELSRILRETA